MPTRRRRLQPCSSPWTRTSLSQGAHTVEIVATDLFGNVDPTPESWTWRVDSVAPVVIDLIGPAAVTSDPDAVLTFDADEPATFECRLNAGPWTSCATTANYPDLPDGAYTFEVRAPDTAGNVGAPAPGATWTWTVLTDPPETVITSGPTGLVEHRQRLGHLHLTRRTRDLRVPARRGSVPALHQPLDGDRTGPGGARPGRPRRGRRRPGRPDPGLPDLDGGHRRPHGQHHQRAHRNRRVGASTFGFTANEASSFSCVLDGGPAQPCASPWPLGSLGSGPHTFSVTATDPPATPDRPRPGPGPWTAWRPW